MCTGVRDDWEGKEGKEERKGGDGGRSPIERHNCLQSTIHMAESACVCVCIRLSPFLHLGRRKIGVSLEKTLGE
jgi:hypothetical protein